MTRTGLMVAISICVVGFGCSDSKPASDAGVADGAVDDGGDGNSGGNGATSGGGASGNGNVGNGSGGSGAGGNGASGSGATDGGAQMLGDGGVLGMTDPDFVIPDALQLCDGPCACADGIDNDGDGTADGFDLECSGPADNDEGSFATGISGDNMDPKWQDCFFDGNSGAGDDGCRYSTKCLTGDLPQDDEDCTVTQDCIDYCRARTPNGCDCFGCCEVFDEDGNSLHVTLTATCDADDLSACETCTPSVDCSNECGECELCPGKTVADLPASCGDDTGTGGTGGGGGTSGGGGMGGMGGMDGSGGNGGTGGTGGGPSYECDDGEPICASNADCDEYHFCVFGCCLLAGPD